MTYCLPRGLVAAFNQAAIPGGKLDPYKLRNMSSPNRRTLLAEVVGDDNAVKLNTAFEKKTLPRYKDALTDWVKESVEDPEVRKNIVDKISAVDSRILDPVDRKAFLEDVAASSLKTKVTMEQAKTVFALAKNAMDLKKTWEQGLIHDIPYEDFYNHLKGEPTRLSKDQRQIVIDRNNYFKAVTDLTDTVESMKPSGKTFTQRLLNWGGQVLLTPKTIQTGILHFSAFDVQLWGSWSEPSVRSGFLNQFKYFANEDNYNFLKAWIMTNPKYDLAVKYKLGLTDLSDKMINREENIPSGLLRELNEYAAKGAGLVTGKERRPINIVAASSRAFTGYQNYVRAHVFYNLVDQLKAKDPEIDLNDSKLVQDAAEVTNNFTGRANLGKGDRYGWLSPILNAVFFAPRKAVAIAQMFNPLEYVKLYAHGLEAGIEPAKEILGLDHDLTPMEHIQVLAEAVRQGNYVVANHAVKNVMSSLAITGALLFLAQASQPLTGYSSHFRPWDQSFGTITAPNGERLGLSGGVATWLRLIGQLVSGRYVNREGAESELGDGYHATTKEELVDRWVRNKLGSTAGAIADWILESTAIGQSPEWTVEARQHLQPILSETVFSYYYNQPDKAWTDLPMLLFMVGAEVESPLPTPTRQGYTFWGEDSPTLHDPVRTKYDSRMASLGVPEAIPVDTIKGVKLNDQQYQEYVKMFGTLNSQFMGNLFDSDLFSNLSKTQQKTQVKRAIALSRKMSQAQIETVYPEIAQKADKLKEEREGLLEPDEE